MLLLAILRAGTRLPPLRVLRLRGQLPLLLPPPPLRRLGGRARVVVLFLIVYRGFGRCCAFRHDAAVPAGISRPTMTFSLSPLSISSLPDTAASVRTRVVSWNDAAEINDRVCKDALVMPSNTGCPVASIQAFFLCRICRREFLAVNLLIDQQSRAAGTAYFNFLQHLADDDFNMLVVDFHALQAIDILNLIDEIFCQFSTPSTLRISCGTWLPSSNASPLRTLSPSRTARALPFGTM